MTALPDYVTEAVLDQWEASAEQDAERGEAWSVNPRTLLAILPVLRAALPVRDGQPVTEAGRRVVDAIKGGALALWADDPGDPIAAMVANVERAARAAARRTIEVYPYGPDVQRHFEELVASGVPDREARDQCDAIEVEWPDDVRLPVVGDGLSVEWAGGHVSSVSMFRQDGEWHVRVHLSRR